MEHASRPPCICAGRGKVSKLLCGLWYVLFPAIWIWQSIRIYVFACMVAYTISAFGRFWLWLGDTLCCWFNCTCLRRCGYCFCFRYEDSDFPPNASSIGTWKGLDEKAVTEKIEWRRGDNICALAAGEHARLFSGTIEPADIGQGQLGDCWLMTALACLAEYPGAIQRVFLTDQYNPRGRYVLQLYCGELERFVTVAIDDSIPVERGTNTPIFAKPNGKELWVALLEKAFAKFVGNYNALDGGYPLWGLQALTGDTVSTWRLEQASANSAGHWAALEIRYNKRKQGFCGGSKAREVDVKFYKTMENGIQKSLADDAFVDQLAAWVRQEFLICASTSGKDEGESTATQGLVRGHAYTVQSVLKVEGIRLLRLRNPWGKFEWTGDWSDASPLWDQHKKAKLECRGGEVKDDGFFWMEWKDFRQHFQSIDVCHRSRSLRDVRLDIHEDDGCKGPVLGCVRGCFGYYCLCKGCRALCCPTYHQHGANNKVVPQP